MRFDYREPKTVQEAIAMLSHHDGKAKVIAGGTDLLNDIRTKIIRPDYVVDIGCIVGLDRWSYDDQGTLSLGALTTISAVEISAEVKEHHPVISQAAGQIGSIAIRNVGTIGGNLCHASPAADMVPPLIALRATVKVVGPAGERTVAVEDFFTGPGRTVLETGEILIGIQVPPMPPQAKAVYLKHAVRGAADLAIVGVAAMVRLEDGRCRNVRIALGAVAPTAMRARRAEFLLDGNEMSDSLIEKAALAAADDCRPITDLRASADYRREMVKVLMQRAIKQLGRENGRMGSAGAGDV